MTNRFPVFNITKNFHVRLKQARKAVLECAAAWVDYEVSIRDLSLAESIQARNKQSSLRDPLEFAEIPGVVFRPPMGQEKVQAEARRLSKEARRFVEAA